MSLLATAMLQTSWGFATLPHSISEQALLDLKIRSKTPLTPEGIQVYGNINALSPSQIANLEDIRTSISRPNENTLMQRVMTENQAMSFFDNNTETGFRKYDEGRITGFMAVADDVAHLRTPRDFINGNSEKPSHSDLNHSYCRF